MIQPTISVLLTKIVYSVFDVVDYFGQKDLDSGLYHRPTITVCMYCYNTLYLLPEGTKIRWVLYLNYIIAVRQYKSILP